MKKVKKITKKYLKKIEKREINKKFKEWSISVKKRDNMKCVICNREDFIISHHIIPRNDKNLRFEIDNGITLCPLHHKYSREISAHNNPFLFSIWLLKNRKEQLSRLLRTIKDKGLLDNGILLNTSLSFI